MQKYSYLLYWICDNQKLKIMKTAKTKKKLRKE